MLIIKTNPRTSCMAITEALCIVCSRLAWAKKWDLIHPRWHAQILSQKTPQKTKIPFQAGNIAQCTSAHVAWARSHNLQQGHVAQLGTVLHACNSSIQEAGVGLSQGCGLFGLKIEFKDSPGLGFQLNQGHRVIISHTNKPQTKAEINMPDRKDDSEGSLYIWEVRTTLQGLIGQEYSPQGEKYYNHFIS